MQRRHKLGSTQTDPKLQKNDIEVRICSVDPNMIVYSATLEDMLRTIPQFVVSRCSAIFASIAGSFGLLLASIGIYGTVSYAVVRRTREVGIRMALGATKRDVVGLILVESTGAVILGLLFGLVGAATYAGYSVRCQRSGRGGVC
jgi:ABC-type antimicrobial peptide transport system permease subunit